MNPSDYRTWMERAFLFVEGALLQRSAEESPIRITEHDVRLSLMQGLRHAKPDRANDVQMETNVPWNRVSDVNNQNRKFGKGRSRQHDVAVKEAAIPRAVCEVKWLKATDSDAILEDLWRLALTHGVRLPERDCCRTFLLVGGLKSAFQNTLKNLRRQSVPLRWSPQGRATQWPKPTRIKFGNLANQHKGFFALRTTLKRRKNYHRTPPTIWWELRCSAVARSYRTIRSAEWKIVLWELDYHHPCGTHQVDWSDLGDLLP
jgi:hypothetical protein